MKTTTLLFLLLLQGAPDTAATLIKNISASYQKFNDLEIPFRQEKHISFLKDPAVSSGTFFWKPDRALFRTLQPEKSEVLLTKTEIALWVPQMKTIEKYDRSTFALMENLSLSVGHNLDKMAADYTISLPSQNKTSATLTFIPKKKRLRKYIQQLKILVRKKDHLIREIAYTDAAGDRTVTKFDVDHLKSNQKLTDKIISLSAPKGTKVVSPLKNR